MNAPSGTMLKLVSNPPGIGAGGANARSEHDVWVNQPEASEPPNRNRTALQQLSPRKPRGKTHPGEQP